MSKLILIGGGTCAGKTTLAGRIEEKLGKENVSIFCTDNYFQIQENMTLQEKKQTNYDKPESIDGDILVENVKDLLAGKKVESPFYDFSIKSRSDKTLFFSPTPLVIVEGIFALCFPVLNQLAEFKIFITADSDLRLTRRVKRDTVERGWEVNEVLDTYHKTVKPGFEKYLEPWKQESNLIVPGWNPYEPLVEMISKWVF